MGSHLIAHADAASRDADPDAQRRDARGRLAEVFGPGGPPGARAMNAHPLLLVARQELVLAVRSRWTQIFALVFAALALAVAASGYVLSGGHGVQDFARTAASLVQLVLLLVPLTSLLIGVLSLAPERGAAELLFSQPISRRTILLGKLLGLFEALVGAQALGFGAAGLVIFSQSGNEGLAGFVMLFAGLGGPHRGLPRRSPRCSPPPPSAAAARAPSPSPWSSGSWPSSSSTWSPSASPRSCPRARPRAC